MSVQSFARFVAHKEFEGKLDKAGKPYIEHLEAVARMVESDDEEVIAIAWLHDLLEDCEDWDYDRLEKAFNERIAIGVDVLTKFPANWDGYIERIKHYPDAVLVKIADLKHNMDVTRLETLGDYEIKRLRKYHAAYWDLVKFKESWA